MARKKDDVNKMDLVRQALNELGQDAKPDAIIAFAKEKANVEIPSKIVSAYKSMLKKKAGGGAIQPARRGRPAGSARSVSPDTGGGRGGNVSMSDIEQVRGLLHRHGPEQLRQLIGYLA